MVRKTVSLHAEVWKDLTALKKELGLETQAQAYRLALPEGIRTLRQERLAAQGLNPTPSRKSRDR